MTAADDLQEEAESEEDTAWPDAVAASGTAQARPVTQSLRRPGGYYQSRRVAGSSPRPLPPAEAEARRRSRAAMISELYRHIRAVGRSEGSEEGFHTVWAGPGEAPPAQGPGAPARPGVPAAE